MNGNLSLLIAAFFPIICAPVAWMMGRKEGSKAIQAMVGATAVEMLMLLILAFGGMGRLPGGAAASDAGLRPGGVLNRQ